MFTNSPNAVFVPANFIMADRNNGRCWTDGTGNTVFGKMKPQQHPRVLRFLQSAGIRRGDYGFYPNGGQPVYSFNKVTHAELLRQWFAQI